MKALHPTRAVIAVAAGLALAACQQPPAPSTAAPASASASTHAIPAPAATPAPAPASTMPLPGDHAVTRHYRIEINLPTLPPADQPLAAALRATADDAKRQFLQALPDPAALPESADRQLEMRLDFKVVAETPAFTSVRETGTEDTGGAHPIPVQAAFAFDRKAGKVIPLDDLFTDPGDARRALANFAHDALLKRLMANAPTSREGTPQAIREWKTNTLQMLADGTKPTTVNYAVFVVRAGPDPTAASPGLTLIFPPYQVAPYVDGTQTVDVPASVFAKYLKPDYQPDFAAR